MPKCGRRVVGWFLPPYLAIFSLIGILACAGAEPSRQSSRPRLAVLVYFDQMRGDYLSRWETLFGEGGFRRLESEGAWFQNCRYPYAFTVTAAGHASVATGCSPDKHGIVANDWYERSSGASVNCVSAERYVRVPPRAKEGEKDKKSKGVSPERLCQPTLADALKEATGGKGRVVALSLKDRSAVLPGGRRPDACYWLDSTTGQFVTSTYYRERLHRWVEEYNKGQPADQWFGKEWTRFRTDLDYARYSGPDDQAGEGKGAFQGRTFPHPMDGGPERQKRSYYSALYNSPYGNELLLELVERAIDAEKLGTNDVPDLLCVSFSSNDPIGHCWGPDSQEVLDVTLRSDLIVKELLAYLDAKVGAGRYVLALTADHGVCPLPEVARKQGKEAARISPAMLSAAADEFLDQRFGMRKEKTPWVEATAGPWVYLNRDLIQRRGLKVADVEVTLAGWLAKQEGVQAVYTRAADGGSPEGDAIGQSVRRSFHPDRCGDLYVLQRPYYVFSLPLGTGTTHGTPHPYDTHVPLLVYGAGIRSGIRKEAVTPQAAAVILAEVLGIKPPSGAEAPVPRDLLDLSAP
jgi:hypothetical protein